MIKVTNGFLLLRVPQLNFDIVGVMQELGRHIAQYLDDAGRTLVDRLNMAAEAATAHLPAEWADNFNRNLDYEVRGIGTTTLEVIFGLLNIPENFDNPEYMQAMVMEFGTSGVRAGPYGRMVWQSDRLRGPRQPSRTINERPLPHFDHAPTNFFENFVRQEQTQFFTALGVEVNRILNSGVLLRHFIVS